MRLLDYFKSGKNKKEKRAVMVVVDFFEHTRGGHFGRWLKKITEEFRKRFTRVVVATPNPSLTKELFKEKSHGGNDITFYKLSKYKRLKKKFTLRFLAKKVTKNDECPVFFIMWGFDLIELIQKQQDYNWATLSGISKLYRQPNDKASNLEFSLLSIIELNADCKGFFQPDEYVRNISDKAIWIPDIENIETLDSSSNLINRVKHFKSSKITIGAFGILTGERCVNELIKLAGYQPDVKFALIGKVVHKTVQPSLQKYLAEKIPNNLFIYPYFLEKEEELNSIIRMINGVFIDGRNYQPHSGIVCKALYFGKGILSPIGNSWTNDLIRENGVGLSYDDPKFDLQLEWTKWMNNNGESKSTATSAKIRSPLAIRKSFDLMTKKLLN